MIYIKSKNEIDLMRTAGKVIANLFEVLERAIKPGVTTLELDRIAEEFIIKMVVNLLSKVYTVFLLVFALQ